MCSDASFRLEGAAELLRNNADWTVGSIALFYVGHALTFTFNQNYESFLS